MRLNGRLLIDLLRRSMQGRRDLLMECAHSAMLSRNAAKRDHA